MVMAGFVDFKITWRADVFSDAPQSSSAADFGTLGINFRARKAVNEEEWLRAMSALNCELPTLSSAIERKNERKEVLDRYSIAQTGTEPTEPTIHNS